MIALYLYQVVQIYYLRGGTYRCGRVEIVIACVGAPNSVDAAARDVREGIRVVEEDVSLLLLYSIELDVFISRKVRITKGKVN